MDINNMNRIELCAKCKELGITRYSSKNKVQLINLVRERILEISSALKPEKYQHASHKTFIELCAGGGGFSSGLIKAGFIPLMLNDIDNDCCETLKKNHAGVNVVLGSMSDIDYSKYINNVDVLVAGTPCQSFSQAGLRKGVEDPRGNLLIKFIEIIALVKPKIFVLENVKGLLSHDKGNTIKIILEKLEESELYRINYKCLNAAEYGVPQKRERVFIIGVLKSVNKEFSFPVRCETRKVLKDVLCNVPTSPGAMYPEKKIELFKKIPQGGCWINLPEDLQKEYLGKSFYSGGGKRGILHRLSMENTSLTILCTPSQKQTERCHPLEERPLTLRECARIQTFDDDYKFIGSISSQYKQIGNAVPVELARLLGIALSKTLQNNIPEIICDEGINTSFNKELYFCNLGKSIESIFNRREKDILSYDLLDTQQSSANKLICLKEKQRQMKIGEIWQECIGSYDGFTNLKTGHITGLDILSETKKIAIEIKNRTNTDKSSSKKCNFDKLAKFKSCNPEYTCIYATVNAKNKQKTIEGVDKNVSHNGVIIKHLAGYSFLDYIFQKDTEIIIEFLKTAIDKYSQ